MDPKDNSKWFTRVIMALLVTMVLTLFTALFSAQVKRLDDHEKRIRDMESIMVETSANVKIILEEIKTLKEHK